MNEALLDIYRHRVLEHSRTPHNERCPHHHNRAATGFNPLCGDKLTIYLRVADGTVADAAFEGSGCAIAMASASMLTDALAGQTEHDAQRMIDAVAAMFRDGSVPADPRLDTIRALENVRAYPSRIKCATLAWSAAAAALQGTGGEVSTEQS